MVVVIFGAELPRLRTSGGLLGDLDDLSACKISVARSAAEAAAAAAAAAVDSGSGCGAAAAGSGAACGVGASGEGGPCASISSSRSPSQ